MPPHEVMRAIYFDLETTGLSPERERIVEIAAYDPQEERTFLSFVHPGMPIPQEAQAFHHITDAMVADAPPFGEVGRAFIDFCPPDAVLIAHNNDSFDRIFLHAEAKRNGLQLPPWKYLDSLKWARKYRPDLPRHTLQFLREIYDIPKNQAHRALDDVVVLYQLFSAMIDDLPLETVCQLVQG